MRDEDERDFVEYISARMPALHRTAYLLCGDRHRADDIVQATAIAVYVNWRRAKAADNTDAYVHRILVRRFLDEKRLGWARIRLMPTPSDALGAGVRAQQSRMSEVDDRDELRGVLAELPGAQRAVLVLRFACDMSVADVAAVLGCSESNVKGHASRGLAALRQALGADFEGGQLQGDPTCIERRKS